MSKWRGSQEDAFGALPERVPEGATISEQRVREMIGERASMAGGIRALSRKWKVSAAYVCDLIHGRRSPGPQILKRLGLTKTVRRSVHYRKVGAE